MAFAAIFAMVLFIGLIWLVIENNRLKTELNQLNQQKNAQVSLPDQPDERLNLQKQLAEQQAQAKALNEQLQQEQNRRGEIEQELAKVSPPKPTTVPNQSFATLILLAGMVRDLAAPPAVELAPAMDQLQLIMVLEDDDFPTYRAELQNDQGEIISKYENLKARSRQSDRALTIKIPAVSLKNAVYRIILFGKAEDGQSERVGAYYFKVLKNKEN
jgi:hypothetical protein